MKLIQNPTKSLEKSSPQPQTNLSEAIAGQRDESCLLRFPIVVVRLSPATTIQDPQGSLCINQSQ